MARTALLILLVGLAAALSGAEVVHVQAPAADKDNEGPHQEAIGAGYTWQWSPSWRSTPSWQWSPSSRSTFSWQWSPSSRRSTQPWKWSTGWSRGLAKGASYGATTPRALATNRPSWSGSAEARTRWRGTTAGILLDRSFTLGYMHQFDRMLQETTFLRADDFKRVFSKDMKFTTPYATIHCVQVADLLKNGMNAIPTVLSGGIGQTEMLMKFQSQYGVMNYTVTIWGQ